MILGKVRLVSFFPFRLRGSTLDSRTHGHSARSGQHRDIYTESDGESLPSATLEPNEEELQAESVALILLVHPCIKSTSISSDEYKYILPVLKIYIYFSR